MPRTASPPRRGLAPKPGFRVVSCPECGDECYCLGAGPTEYWCARHLPVGRWASTVKPPRPRAVAAALQREPQTDITLNVMPRSVSSDRGISTETQWVSVAQEAPMAGPATPSGTTERADYGDAAAAPATAHPPEHPSIGGLRAAYREIENAVRVGFDTSRGVPSDIEIELRRAQAIVVEQARRLKEAA